MPLFDGSKLVFRGFLQKETSEKFVFSNIFIIFAPTINKNIEIISELLLVSTKYCNNSSRKDNPNR